MENIIYHFNERSEKYNNTPLWVSSELIKNNLLKMIEHLDKRNIIDIGAGTGITLIDIVNHYNDVNLAVALDISDKMLENIKNDKIIKQCADAHYIPYNDNIFNLAIAKQSLHYMENIAQVFSEIYRILDNNGSVIIGQLMPYGNQDYDYWKKIINVRQPLRKNYLTFQFVMELLLNNNFHIESVISFRVKESLNQWIERYNNMDSTKAQLLKNLLLNAPSYYKKIYDIVCDDNDIIFYNCWYWIKASVIK